MTSKIVGLRRDVGPRDDRRSLALELDLLRSLQTVDQHRTASPGGGDRDFQVVVDVLHSGSTLRGDGVGARLDVRHRTTDGGRATRAMWQPPHARRGPTSSARETNMHRSTERIITTHVGSLARPTELLEMMRDKEAGKPYDHAAFDRQVRDAVADRVHRQVECGIDVVTDGEMGKVSFLTYVKDRLGGFAEDDGDMILPASWRKEIEDFPGFYNEYFKKYTGAVAPLKQLVCTGPVTYVGQEQLETDIANLKSALADDPAARGVHAVVGPERFRPQRALRIARRVPRGGGRGDACRVPRHRRRRVRAADRRPVADGDPVRSDHRRRHQAARCAGARRRAQRVAARHSARVDPPPHLLRAQPRSAPHRHPARDGDPVDDEDRCRRVLVRGGQPAPSARVEGVGGRRPPGRRVSDPRTCSATRRTTSNIPC